MKTRHTIILIILGLSLQVVGSLFKILHLQWADLMLVLGGVAEIVGSLLFCVKFLSNPKVKEFLDW